MSIYWTILYRHSYSTSSFEWRVSASLERGSDTGHWPIFARKHISRYLCTLSCRSLVFLVWVVISEEVEGRICWWVDFWDRWWMWCQTLFDAVLNHCRPSKYCGSPHSWAVRYWCRHVTTEGDLLHLKGDQVAVSSDPRVLAEIVCIFFTGHPSLNLCRICSWWRAHMHLLCQVCTFLQAPLQGVNHAHT